MCVDSYRVTPLFYIVAVLDAIVGAGGAMMAARLFKAGQHRPMAAFAGVIASLVTVGALLLVIYAFAIGPLVG